MTNLVYSRQTLSTVWQTLSTEVCLFESGPGLADGGYLRAAQRPWCRLMGLLWEIFWLHGQVCLHYDKICLHMTNFVYSMTKFVYTYDTYDQLPAYDKLCLHHDKPCLHQANFVMHLTIFVCITQTTASAQPLHRHCAASAQPMQSLCTASAQPLHSHCAATVQPLYSLCIAPAQPLHNPCAASAQPVHDKDCSAADKLCMLCRQTSAWQNLQTNIVTNCMTKFADKVCLQLLTNIWHFGFCVFF